MGTPEWSEDEALMEELREALAAAGPVSEEMRAMAVGAFAWRDIDADLALAELVFDSAVDETPLVRAAGTDMRAVVFEHGDIAIQLELTSHGLVGQVAPATSGDVVVQTQAGREAVVAADELGMFSVAAVPDETFRVRAMIEGRPVVTQWLHP